jgi:hypothetical protein
MMSLITTEENGKRVLHELDALMLHGHQAYRLPPDALNRQLRALGVPGVDPSTGRQDALLCLSKFQKAQAAAEVADLERRRAESAALVDGQPRLIPSHGTLEQPGHRKYD